ncbi:Rab5 GDP/GTP exchange factor [Chamberlinius hualienensis]
MSSDRGGKISFHIDKSDLLCKNSCGFYGNPAWQGYCSKCYREICQKSKRNETFKTKSQLTRSGSEPISESALGFSKFDEKRRQHFDKRVKTVKSIFRKTNSTKESTTVSPWQCQRQNSFESQQACRDFTEYLKTLRESIAQEINKEIRLFIDRVYKEIDTASIDDISELAQKFYQTISDKMKNFAPFKNDPTHEHMDTLMDFTEKYVMTTLYKTVFCPSTTDDEERDLAVQNHIRSFNWIQARHLETDINERNVLQRDALDKAITAIIEMDSKRAPQEKLSCIVRCSKHICDMLQLTNAGQHVSADHFLPAMIFVVLRANPPMFQSNINYVTRFCNQNRLMSGEGGYYFTNLCCAFKFIQDLNADSLNLPKEEFNRYMTGEAVPPRNYQHEPFLCEGVRIMNQNMSTVTDLKQRHEKLVSEVIAVNEEIITFKDDVAAQIQAVLDKCPWTILPRKTPTNIDSEDTECALLPDPIQPEVVANTSFVGPAESDKVTFESSEICTPVKPRGPYSPTFEDAVDLPPPIMPEVINPCVHANGKC